jgi:glycosyltransferase involved in cell wall biosynthesis
MPRNTISPNTRFSVVICTRNRARLLERAIESVLAQRYPAHLYEVIVVDNGSTAPVRAVCEHHRRSAAVLLAYYVEERAGVAFARNLGAARAQYEYVAFLDDDATACPGWLAEFDRAIRLYGALVVGGRVDPVIETGIELPRWWSEWDIRCLFGLDHGRALGGQPVSRIHWPLWLGGGNSVYSKKVLEKFGFFRTDLGPTGRRRRVAEDIDLNVRLQHAGMPIYYAHHAVIQHLVTADRLKRRHLWRRAYWSGRTDAGASAILNSRMKPATVSQLAGVALRLLLSREPQRTILGCRLANYAGRLVQSRLRILRRPTAELR